VMVAAVRLMSALHSRANRRVPAIPLIVILS
jgi:hypothetical protein